MIRILTASHFGSKTVHTKRYDFAYMPKREFDAFCDTYDNKDDHVAIVGETLLNEVKYADFPCVTWHCVDERGDVHLRIELSDAIFLESTVNQSYGNMAEPHEPNVYFEVSKKLYGYTVGYIYVGTDEKTGKEQFVTYKKHMLLPLLFMSVFLLMLIILLRGCISHTLMPIDETPTETELSYEDYVPMNTDDDTEEDVKYYDVWMPGDYVISEDCPDVPVYNSDTNTRAFQWDVYVDGNLIGQTKAIVPGAMSNVDLSSLLSEKGEHDISFQLTVLNMDTGVVVGSMIRDGVLTIE